MAIRSGDWKLVKSSEGPLRAAGPGEFNLSSAELYNLASDIGEKNNLAATQPTKVRELAAAWQRWNQQLAKPLWGPGARGEGAPR
jgi:arylsulfatase A-like enzyme